MAQEADLKLLLYEALNSEFGIEVQTSNCAALRQKLYQVRAKEQKAGNDDFNGLAIHLSPEDPEGKLWIEKQGKDHGKDKSEEGDT